MKCFERDVLQTDFAIATIEQVAAEMRTQNAAASGQPREFAKQAAALDTARAKAMEAGCAFSSHREAHGC